ncbi:MAG: tRNA lysidine(34) synthetase TilS [Kiritimatiellia bacterium]
MDLSARFAQAMDRLLDGLGMDSSRVRLLAAVSGGSDSMALLHLLAGWRASHGAWLGVLHLNHGLRGAASDEDERFVESASARLGLPFFRGAPDAPLAGQPGSLEQKARTARRAFFVRTAREARAAAVCTGHTREDVAETLLMRLLRGSGAAGLSGLRPCRELSDGCPRGASPGAPPPCPVPGDAAENGAPLFLLRPLLEFSRAELRDWLVGRGEGWREDASNEDAAIPRNAVRHRLLPVLEAAGEGGVREALARSSAILHAEDEFLDALARDALASMRSVDASRSGFELPVADLLAQPLALRRRVVRLALMEWGTASGFDVVARVLALADGLPGARLALGPARFAERTAAGLRFREWAPPPAVPPPPRVLPIPGETRWGGLRARVEFGSGIVRDTGPLGRVPAMCSLSRLEVERAGGLLLRARLPGDRIRPLGMEGSRKVQDVLVDAGVPREERDGVPILCAGGEVAWIPGYRIARRFALRNPDDAAILVRLLPAGDP